MGFCLGIHVVDDHGVQDHFEGLRRAWVRVSTTSGELSLVLKDSGKWRLGEQ